jgi:hypothetical protein
MWILKEKLHTLGIFFPVRFHIFHNPLCLDTGMEAVAEHHTTIGHGLKDALRNMPVPDIVVCLEPQRKGGFQVDVSSVLVFHVFPRIMDTMIYPLEPVRWDQPFAHPAPHETIIIPDRPGIRTNAFWWLIGTEQQWA